MSKRAKAQNEAARLLLKHFRENDQRIPNTSLQKSFRKFIMLDFNGKYHTG